MLIILPVFANEPLILLVQQACQNHANKSSLNRHCYLRYKHTAFSVTNFSVPGIICGSVEVMAALLIRMLGLQST